MIKFVVVLAVATFALGAPQTKLNIPRLDGRIVGGESVDIEQYPHQVSLLYSSRHICGGSIISTKFVVTAAHCTYGSSASSLQIRAGSSIVNTGGVVVKVAKIHQHPDFDYGTIDYDVSVLELETELTLGPSVGKINLPTANQNVPAGTDTVVTGWGALKEGGSSPRDLQAVKVPIVDHAKCKDAYSSLATVTDRMICAGVSAGGKDACQGDSGGPLVAGNNLVGIVSWGYGCARPQYPGVYSSVPALRDYIKQVSGI